MLNTTDMNVLQQDTKKALNESMFTQCALYAHVINKIRNEHNVLISGLTKQNNTLIYNRILVKDLKRTFYNTYCRHW